MASWLRDAPPLNSTNKSISKGGPIKTLAQMGTFGFIPQLAASITDELDKIIPGGTKAGVDRAKTAIKTDPLRFTPLSMREQIVPATKGLGKALGNEQAGEDIGYGLRGALSITPMQRPKFLGGKLEATTPTTTRQKAAETVGRTAYGTALTLPIGGPAAIPSRVVAGAGLGAGMSVGAKALSSIAQGKLPALSEVGETAKTGAVSGIENSWMLAFTQLGLDAALSAAASKFPALSKLTSVNTGAPFQALSQVAPEVRQQLFAEGAKRLLGRAVLETLPENTAFTFLDKISGKNAEPFVNAWVKNLPGALGGNLLFAGLQIGKGRVYDWNKVEIGAAVEAFKKAAKQVNIEDLPIGLQAKDISKQLLEGATPRQVETLNKLQAGKKSEIEMNDFADIQTFLRNKGFQIQAGKIVPMESSAQQGTVEGRPQSQIDIERAIQARDYATAKSLVDSLPEGDPYKQSMQSLDFYKQVQEPKSLLAQLRDAQLANDLEAEQRLTDQIRAEGQPVKTTIEAPVASGTQDSAQTEVLSPVQKIIIALQEAEPKRAEQQALYSQYKSAQEPVLKNIQAEAGGEAGAKKMMSSLVGELPKVEFTGIRNKLVQADVDSLFNEINTSNQLSTWEKVPAIKGLGKLLQPEGGQVPTESELRLLNKVFPPEFTQAVLNNRPKMQVLMDNAAEVLNVPRALMASLDASAPLRQGWLLWPRRLLTNPKQGVSEIVDMLKYFANEDAYKAGIDEINSRPNRQLMEEAGLQITAIDDPTLTGREEVFMSNLAEKIPGIGRFVRSSDRAYTGFLNKLRADTFDSLVKTAQDEKRELTPALLSSMGKFVNSASGRGDLGKLAEHAKILNSFFFSPRLMASRFNALNPAYYASLDPLVRKEAVKSLVTSVGSAVTILTLAKLGGAQVTADPRNADFGKIRIGNTRIDVTGGFGTYIRLVAQFLSGKIVDSTTGREIILNEETFNPINRGDVLSRFFQSKEAPTLSFATGLLNGKNGIGEKYQVGPEIINSFTPLFLQDLFETIREQGIVSGAIMSVPAFFGAGVQTYGEKIPVRGTTATGKPNIQYREKPSLGETLLNTITGQKASTFSPQQQEALWRAEFQKRIRQAEKDKRTVGRKSDANILQNILPGLSSNKTAQPTTTNRPVWTR